jgi:predicted  nucleic acid-binding Zn-ribbon protein
MALRCPVILSTSATHVAASCGCCPAYRQNPADLQHELQAAQASHQDAKQQQLQQAQVLQCQQQQQAAADVEALQQQRNQLQAELVALGQQVTQREQELKQEQVGCEGVSVSL